MASMRYVCPLIVVEDMERSKRFYETVLDCQVTADFGANVTMSGGFSLQTMESWKGFLHTDQVTLGGNDGELYFEAEDLDLFLQKLAAIPDIAYVHPVKTHSWGQRAVRIYDPDWHILEIGERIECVAERLFDQGMDYGQIALRMDVQEAWVRTWLSEKETGSANQKG